MSRLLILIALTVFGQAVADTPSRYDNGPRQAVEAARAAWVSAAPENYAFKVLLTCFCMTPPIHVTVKKNRVTRVAMEVGPEHEYAGKSVPRSEWSRYYALPIPELVSYIDTFLKDGSLLSAAEFDAKLGYPTRFKVEGSAGIADSTSGFVIEEFKVLK